MKTLHNPMSQSKLFDMIFRHIFEISEYEHSTNNIHRSYKAPAYMLLISSFLQGGGCRGSHWLAHKNNQSTISWLYYCLSWKYNRYNWQLNIKSEIQSLKSTLRPFVASRYRSISFHMSGNWNIFTGTNTFKHAEKFP